MKLLLGALVLGGGLLMAKQMGEKEGGKNGKNGKDGKKEEGKGLFGGKDKK